MWGRRRIRSHQEASGKWRRTLQSCRCAALLHTLQSAATCNFCNSAMESHNTVDDFVRATSKAAPCCVGGWAFKRCHKLFFCLLSSLWESLSCVTTASSCRICWICCLL